MKRNLSDLKHQSLAPVVGEMKFSQNKKLKATPYILNDEELRRDWDYIHEQHYKKIILDFLLIMLSLLKSLTIMLYILFIQVMILLNTLYLTMLYLLKQHDTYFILSSYDLNLGMDCLRLQQKDGILHEFGDLKIAKV